MVRIMYYRRVNNAKKKYQQGNYSDHICFSPYSQFLLPAEISCSSFVSMGHNTWYFLLQIVFGGKFMKVVLIKSPKIFSGFLRMIFGIKKNQDNT